MKKLFLLTIIVFLTGCNSDLQYGSRDYYSSGGGVSTYPGETTSGYNRDYQEHTQTAMNDSGYSSSGTPAPDARGGYSSSISNVGGYSS